MLDPITLAPSTVTSARDASDEELVARIKTGDRRAANEIVRRHQPRLLRVASRITRDETDANDVVQEAFVQAFRKLDQFQGDAQFATWLHRVTVNAALMWLRSKKRHTRNHVTELVSPTGEPAEPIDEHAMPVDDVVIARELLGRVSNALGRLPEMYRTVMLSRSLDDLTGDEAAEELGLTRSMVKTRLYRARLMVQKSIARQTREAA